MRLFVVGFQGESHQQAAALVRSKLGGDVARAAQGDAHVAVAFLDFGVRNPVGGVVGHGGAHHGPVGPFESPDRGVVHLGGREHVHSLHARGRRQLRAARDKRHAGPSVGQLPGNGIAHLARGVVRDEPHGVDGFDRGSCRDDQPFTLQALFFFTEKTADECGDRIGFGHAALALKTAGQFAFARLDDVHAASGECPEVLLRGLVGVHVQVHGGSHGDRTAGREVDGQQQVVGDAGGHFGQGVGRGGGDQVAVGPFAQRHVGVPRAVFGVEELHQNRVLRERGHRQGRDELLRQRSHHHAHVGAGRLQ